MSAFQEMLNQELSKAEADIRRELTQQITPTTLSVPMKVKDLHAGDRVQDYGTVEWIEMPEGPNALVDFVGVERGVYLVKSMRVRVLR